MLLRITNILFFQYFTSFLCIFFYFNRNMPISIFSLL